MRPMVWLDPRSCLPPSLVGRGAGFPDPAATRLGPFCVTLGHAFRTPLRSLAVLAWCPPTLAAQGLTLSHAGRIRHLREPPASAGGFVQCADSPLWQLPPQSAAQ